MFELSQSFEDIFEENYPKILNYIARRTADAELAKDICSEVFLKAFSNRFKFQWRSIPVSAWLYKIAINEIRMHYRKGKIKTDSLETLMEEKGIEPRDPEYFIDELKEAQKEIDDAKKFLGIQKNMTELPLIYQEVISLRFFENKKISEIAEILSKRKGTIKSLLSRGLEKLRNMQPSLETSIVDDEASIFTN